MRRVVLSAALAAVVSASLASPATAAGENLTGKWTGLITLPLVPSSAALRADGKVLLWSADGEFSFSWPGQVYSTVFDPATNTAGPSRLFAGGHNMFCTGTTVLPDGRILANGGSQSAITTLYDPKTDTFRRVQDMNIERGYNANTILTDGSVFTLGGSWSGAAGDKGGEIWTEAGGWRRLTGVPTTGMTTADPGGSSANDNHYWLKPTGNGKVLFVGPTTTMQWIDTTGSGSVKPAGLRGDDGYSVNGTAVMWDTGRILKAGGAASYSGTYANAGVYEIDVRSGAASVSRLSPMSYGRTYHNAVVLPDGKVMVVGGGTAGTPFYDDFAVLPTEIWDPATRLFTLAAPVAAPRGYHSIALLLPDGRVLSGGGGLCGAGCAGNHADVQVYSPGYLFNADGSLRSRPTITSAPAKLPYGRSVTVTTDREVASFSVVRMGSTTHTVNNDQRRLSLAFVRTGANTYQVQVPSNPGWLLPGPWMLFALDAAGTPSVARTVTVDTTAIATMVAPDPIVTAVGRPIAVQPTINRIGASVTFAGEGFPPGVSVNPTTGAIQGTAWASGTYAASVTATDGQQTVSVDVAMSVEWAPGNGTGLRGDYFANVSRSGAPALTRVEALDFAFGAAGPGGGLPATGFSARWTGTILAGRTGATRFRTTSDDGVRVWIGGKLVVDNWAAHAPTQDEGSVDLVAGQKHPITVEYYNGSGTGTLRLEWLRLGDTAFSTVPASELFVPTSIADTNIAAGKPAGQSSQQGQAGAARAVDGSTAGAAGAIALTASEARPWWQVDLGASSEVDRVQIWNRTDCCGGKLANFHVFLSPTDMTGRTLDALLADGTVVKRSVGASVVTDQITLPVQASGRWLRVQLAGTDELGLAEVEVFGVGGNAPPVMTALAPRTGLVGSAASFTVTATDPEGGALTYSATGLPPGVTIAATTGLVSGSPSAVGVYEAVVTARDPVGATASASFTWTVTVQGDLPSVTSMPVRPVPAGTTVTYQPVIANGAGASFGWSWGDGTADSPLSATASRSHLFTTPGVYGVTLTMRLPDGRQSTYRVEQSVHPVVPANPAPPPASGMAIETRTGASSRLWVANPDTDTVGVVDLATNTLVGEVVVGIRPTAVAIHPNGEAWVVNKESDTVSIVAPTTLTVRKTVTLPRGSRPHGIVFINTNAFVTLEATGKLAGLWGDGNWGGTVDVGGTIRHLSASADRYRILLPRFVTPPLPGESTATVATRDASGNPVGGEVVTFDTGKIAVTARTVLQHSEKPDTEVSARGFPNYLGAAAISPDGKTAWVPSKQDNLRRGQLRDGQPLDFQTSVRAIVSKIDLTNNQEILSARIDLDNSGIASAALFHPTGAWLFVALQTSREVAVVDPALGRELFRFAVGRAPSTLAISADGATLYVGNFMDRTVSVINLGPLVTTGRLAVSTTATVRTIRTEKLPADVLKGKQFFYDAADRRLARDGYVSCAVCHDNGEHDGRVWDFTGFGEGLRNTVSLAGHAGMSQGFLHWSANFDEIQDFEGQIRGFAAGTGLMSDAAFAAGTRAQPLGDRKAGLSADLDALAAYVSSLTRFPTSPTRPTVTTMSRQANTGRLAFQRLGCASCHGTNAMTSSADASRLRNVGTIKPTSGKRLGGPLVGIDPPTLRGLFATAPYLHDGSAATIEAAIAAHTTLTTTAQDRTDIAAFLREVGWEANDLTSTFDKW